MSAKSFSFKANLLETHNRNKRFLLAVAFGIGNRIATLANHAVIVTFAIPFLGAETFGIWTTSSSLLAWLGLGNSGMSLGLISQLSNRNPETKTESLVASSFFVLCGISMLLALLVLPCVLLLPLPPSLLSTSLGQSSVRFILFTSASFACLTIPFSIGYSALQGLQRGDIAAKASTAAVLVFTLACLLLIQFSASKLAVIFGLSLGIIFPLLAQTLVVCRMQVLVPSPLLFDYATALSSLKLGLGFFISSAFALVFNQGNVLIAGVFLDPSSATSLDLMNRISMTVYSIVGTIIWPIWPSFGDAIANGDVAWLRRAFLLCLVVPIIPCGLLFAVLWSYGQPIIYYLTSGEVECGQALLAFTVLNSTLVCFYMPIQSLLGAAKAIKPQIYAGLIQSLTFLTLSAILVPRFGITGLPAAQCFAIGLVSLPLLGFSCWKILRIDHDSRGEPQSP